MKPIITAALCSFVALAACDSENPFMEDTAAGGGSTASSNPTNPTDPGDTGNGFEVGGGGTPPGIDGPGGTPNNALVRYEERNENGGGYAEDFSFDPVNDEFSVDNLAFDGEGPYTRGATVAALGPNGSYLVYDASVTVPDFSDGDAVNQIALYRAIVGVSKNDVGSNARSSFAIVRTGGYVGYGFGGFVYQREGGVVMPTGQEVNNQATFNGDYAGVRIFSGGGGLEYTQADMELDIDFNDPTEAVGAVKLRLTNRVAFDAVGGTVTLGNDGDAGQLPLPSIITTINGDTGNITADGDITGDVSSVYVDPDGNVVDYEQGNYYAILAGDTTDPADGGEVVGIIVLESTDPRFDGVTAQETGGFILYRDGP